MFTPIMPLADDLREEQIWDQDGKQKLILSSVVA